MVIKQTDRSCDSWGGGSESRREKLQKITQETRFRVIQNILMHPKGLPSLEELVFINPDKSRSTIREHLQTLIEMGVVEEVPVPEDEIKRDLPRKYYGINKEAKEFLEDVGLLNFDSTLEFAYQNVNKTEKIRRYEEAERPNRD